MPFNGELPPQGIIKCEDCGVRTDDIFWDYKDLRWCNPLCYDCFKASGNYIEEDYEDNA